MQVELTALSDQVWERTRGRLAGLTDEEYFWEPAPGAWSVRRRRDGIWREDWSPPVPKPSGEPVTTLAWRLWHLIDMYGEDRAPRWLGIPPRGLAVGCDSGDEPPHTANDAVRLLERAHERWDAHLALATDDVLAEQIGPVAPAHYAGRTRTAYVLHMLDEFVHHGAEIGLLRDLWHWTRADAEDDPIADAIVRGDLDLLQRMGGATAEHVTLAARYGRWDAVADLVERGVPVAVAGETPLHLAAGAGELAVVQALLAHGADASATDPTFHATPLGWARFLQQDTVAEHLERLSDA